MVDMSSKGFFASLFRELIAGLDSFIYKLLAGIYNVFFNVATADVLQAKMLKELFGRVEIILGVIILFKLVISFFSGVVDPDSVNDQKKGFGGVIKRVVVVLVMLLMIVPLNIPGVTDNKKATGMASWNRNMNNHGILFGTLYELQRRVLNENLIFKLINGKQPAKDKEEEYNEHRDAGESFSLDVLKTFIMPNVIDDDANFDDECKNEGDTQCVCWYEKTASGGNASSDKDDVKLAMQTYFSDDLTIDQLLSEDVITAFCRDLSKKAADMNKDGKWKHAYYALAYSKLWSTIIGALFCVLLLSLTVDVAVRLFKLVLLEVISPIAILSYIDPASEKSFKNWTKALTETYLALFIRIAIISFILFIINNISLTGFGLQNPNGFVGFVSKILIYFGLIMFAKEAPKFITQSLGIESKEGNGLFSGMGKLVKGTVGTAAAITGGISTARAARDASLKATEINNPDSKHTHLNKAKARLSGIVNGVGATVSTGKNYAQAKDHGWRQSLDKVNSANAYRLQNAAEGGTWWGQKKEQIKQDFTGDSYYSQLKRQEKDLKDRLEEKKNQNAKLQEKIDGLGQMKSYGEEQAVKKGAQFKYGKGQYKINEFIASLEAAKNRGDKNVKLKGKDANGNTINHTMTLEAAITNLQEFQEAAGRDYLQHSENYNNNERDGGIINFEAQTGYKIDSSMTADDFAKSFKMEKINAINEVKDIQYGVNNVSAKDSIRGLQEQLEETAKNIATAQANYRGTDGRPGGK